MIGDLSGIDPASDPVFNDDGGLLAVGDAIVDTRTGAITPLPLFPAIVCSIGEHVLPLQACGDRPPTSP